MILNDRQIRELCSGGNPMIHPFVPEKTDYPSYGLSSFGYDVRLGYRILRQKWGHGVAPLDPLVKDESLWEWEDTAGTGSEHFVLRPGETVLGETVEVFNIPPDVIGLCVGKSTYARLGLLLNSSPLEPAWRGKLVLELTNLSRYPLVLHPGKGIAQILFFRGEYPDVAYNGHYQNQKGITLPGKVIGEELYGQGS